MSVVSPPVEELDLLNLLKRARELSLEFAKVKGLDNELIVGHTILEVETKVTSLVSDGKSLEAYDYLTSLATSVAHAKGLGNPEF